jgi:ATP-dependent HslUV protease ATP-binding subunit HslU
MLPFKFARNVLAIKRNHFLSHHHNNISPFQRVKLIDFSSNTIFNQQEQQQQQHHGEEGERQQLDTSGREDMDNNVDNVYLNEDHLTPAEVVKQLNRYIVGQEDAKRAVAIALRNRWRRHRLPSQLREEILPKNILMIGPTGVGKTEIARRLAKLSDAPFIKVEATKFTEVGFHGRDVDQIIRDLVDIAIAQTKARARKKNLERVQKQAEDYILDCLVGDGSTAVRENYRAMLRAGELDDRVIDIELPDKPQRLSTLTGSAANLQEGLGHIQDLFSMMGKSSKKRSMKVKDARPLIEDNEVEKTINMEQIVKEAIATVEQDGIVVIDEIDKICSPDKHHGHDASSDGVQRDLLPLIEGTVINTKYGNVNTDHILFIASGAFHSSKPSDMLAELQGRLPIRVELQGLTEADMYRILTEPESNILKQNKALLETENVKLDFNEESIQEIARVAAELNTTVENIGARRLITVVEKILEDISFNAPKMSGQSVVVTAEMVRDTVKALMSKSDLSKFVL